MKVIVMIAACAAFMGCSPTGDRIHVECLVSCLSGVEVASEADACTDDTTVLIKATVREALEVLAPGEICRYACAITVVPDGC